MPRLSLKPANRVIVSQDGISQAPAGNLGGISGVDDADLVEDPEDGVDLEASFPAPETGIEPEGSESELLTGHGKAAAPSRPSKQNSSKSGPEVATAIPGAKNKRSEWEGRDLFVGFPCYKQTNPVTAWTLVAFALDFGKEKIRFDMEIGDAMIYHARNRLAMKFLETDAKWLLFLDDDMIAPIGRPGFLKEMARLPDTYPLDAMALHTVHRLVGHRKEIVGATYFARHPGGRAINSLWQNEDYLARAFGFQDAVLPCDWVGTGCLLIARGVFERMMKKFPELKPGTEGMPWNFFQPMTDGRGEDIAFCARARECGIQPYVDTRLHAVHVGYGTYGSHTAR